MQAGGLRQCCLSGPRQHALQPPGLPLRRRRGPRRLVAIHRA